ncbi:MAG: polysaccharide biosynthesis/export family protein [Terracidiphilus sp.]
MKISKLIWLSMLATGVCLAQQQPAAEQGGTGATSAGEFSNLPIARIGVDDLIGISVYDAPELTRTARVNAEGNIRLPMVGEPIHAAGLLPVDLEKAIAAALVRDHVLVDPVVTVSIAEYQSHPITVVGAVRTPVTFQSVGNLTLLDAISRAGGIADNAGAEIFVTHSRGSGNDKSTALTETVPVRSLLDPNDPGANLNLQSGDIVRVPVAGQVYVVGDVNRPGPFYITDGSESSILKAMAISGGLAPFSSHTAYIYRLESDHKNRAEIRVELEKIMKRKSPDVELLSDDILYIPDATGRRIAAKTLETSLGLSLTAASLALLATQ